MLVLSSQSLSDESIIRQEAFHSASGVDGSFRILEWHLGWESHLKGNKNQGKQGNLTCASRKREACKYGWEE